MQMLARLGRVLTWTGCAVGALAFVYHVLALPSTTWQYPTLWVSALAAFAIIWAIYWFLGWLCGYALMGLGWLCRYVITGET